MIHRVIFGSIERFIGILIEHYAGKFPVWLAPVQVKLLPISEKYNDYSVEVMKHLREHDIRCEIDNRDEKIGFKIREAQMEKVPYMLVIGDKEMENGQVAVRSRKEGDLGPMPLDKFIEKITEEVRNKVL
jgi:threonyl-tRNA synthetase